MPRVFKAGARQEHASRVRGRDELEGAVRERDAVRACVARESLRAGREALSGAGEQATGLERTYAASGFETAVRELAQWRLDKLNERGKRGEYAPASEYVNAYTRLGDKGQALSWLDKAVQERNQFALEVRGNPLYDKLRSDPRFQDLVNRAGLPR